MSVQVAATRDAPADPYLKSRRDGAHWSIYRGDAIRRRTLAVADLLAAATALILGTKVLGAGRASIATLALVPLIVLIGKALGIYERDELVIRKGTLEETSVIFQLSTLYALVVWLVNGYLLSVGNRHELLVLWGSLFVSLIAFRTLARHISRAFTPPERCLLIGDSLTCGRMEEKLASRNALHAEVIAHIPLSDVLIDAGSNGTGHRGLQPLVSRLQVDRIILMPERADGDEVLDLIRAASLVDVKVSVLPRLFEVVGSSVEFDDVDGVTLLSVPRLRLSRSSQVLKRVFDLGGAFIASVLLAPAMVLIAVAIKLDSRGQVLFRQRRVGQHGETFEMFKFRTMVPEADQRKDDLRHLNEANGLFKILNDPRITRIGGVLRRTSLDELPQLLNVIRGDMSLVGPRPLVLEEDSRIAGWERRRLDLTPGMTGHWQILGSARIPLDEMVKLDYLYVTNWSLWLDVKILLRTVPYVIARRGM
jgi:exopolysaccharide biosynthesis polyprenyl glycosylphosphotransferase